MIDDVPIEEQTEYGVEFIDFIIGYNLQEKYWFVYDKNTNEEEIINFGDNLTVKFFNKYFFTIGDFEDVKFFIEQKIKKDGRL